MEHNYGKYVSHDTNSRTLRRELEPNSNKQYNKAIYYQRVIQSD